MDDHQTAHEAHKVTTDADVTSAVQSTSKPELVTGWKRTLYLTVAAVFFVLGVIGAVIPGLPATPFLLLTSYLLVRSSPKLNDRLLKSRLVGPILCDWQQRGGVRASVKWKAITIVVLAVFASLYFASLSPVPTAIVSVAAAIGILVILKLPTIE